MGCATCGDKPNKPARGFPGAVVEIHNPPEIILFRKVVLPSSMGTEEDSPASVGRYKNVLLVYEANGHAYLYSSDGIPTQITTNTEELERRVAELGIAIAEETTAREEGDATLNARIELEETNRAAADAAIEQDIVEETAARAAADSALSSRIDSLSSSLSAETAAREQADAALEGSINNLTADLEDEATARETADTALGGRIDTVANNLATETANRVSADEGLQADIAAEATARANGDATLNTAIASEATARQDADTTLGNRVTAIEEKIPVQASAQNQLADKDFVNSSVATNTANYISNNGQPFNSLAELEAYSGTLTNNDYAFVTGTDAQGNTFYDRYKYNADTGEWAFEYELNNSSFTAVQWAAINSGITSGDVTKIGRLPNTIIASIGSSTADSDKAGFMYQQNNLSTGAATNYTKFIPSATQSLAGVMSAADKTKLDGLANIQTIGANLALTNGELSGAYSDFIGTDGTAVGTAGLVPAPATTDANKYLKSDGTWDTVQAGPTVVQTTGTSTTDVMSQNATTSMVYADPSTKQKVQIGYDTNASGVNSVAIGSAGSGHGATARGGAVAIGAGSLGEGTGAVAIGADAKAWANGSIALGELSSATLTGEMNIGSTSTSYGYNSSNYRLLTGLYDGQSDHDAVTVGQLNTAIAGAGGTKELTIADYNYPTDNPTSVALWMLEPGLYYWDTSVAVRAYQHATLSNSTMAMVTNVGGNATGTIQIYCFNTAGGSSYATRYSVNSSTGAYDNLAHVLFSNIIAQSTGTSTTNIMSQKAVTDALATAGAAEINSTDWSALWQ